MFRTLLLVLLLMVAAPQARAFQAQNLVFDVTQNGSPFGTHRITVRPSGDTTSVSVAISLRATAGPITLFSYNHTCTEAWQAEALQSLDCTTRRGGRTTRVTAQAGADGIRVTGPRFTGVAPANLLPSSWWNVGLTSATRMINTENGRLEPIRVRNMGSQAVTVGARSVQATHFQIAGSIVLDAWYDASGRLVRMAFTAQGRRIEYRLRG